MTAPFTLEDIFAATPVLLAPMAGATDAPFRRQAARFGARYTVSEMVASEALGAARPDMVRRTLGASGVSPLVIQLAGREPHWMQRGAALAEAAGADVIDINMGCPAKAVTAGQSGAALMREPDLALRLIEAVVAGTQRPVTLKMRLGWCANTHNAAWIAARAQAAGVRMITVHARTRMQFFKGAPDWAAVRPVVEACRIPVVVNGDVTNAATASAALEASGARGVMVGRAAMGKPWLPGMIEAALQGRIATQPDLPVQGASLSALYQESLELYGRELGARVARKHIAAWLEGAGAPPSVRSALCREEDPRRVQERIAAFYQHAPEALAA